MIEPTDEMVHAFMRAYADADDGSSKVILEWTAERAGLAAVLAIVERDYEPVWPRFERCRAVGEHGRCARPSDHMGAHEAPLAVYWPAAVCRRCGSPLTPCDVCGKPSQCGDAWCTDHVPDGTS